MVTPVSTCPLWNSSSFRFAEGAGVKNCLCCLWKVSQGDCPDGRSQSWSLPPQAMLLYTGVVEPQDDICNFLFK